MNASIRIISTGGTIDSSPDYDPNKKSVFRGTRLPDVIAQARLSTNVLCEALMQKDSADLTEDDRVLIHERSAASPERLIVITHGTDTMCETARFLGHKGVGGKTLVLVGSFVPISQANSDAIFNLGYAIAAVQHLPAGVWVAMGGEVYSWDNVQKNTELRRFEKVRS